MIEHGIWSQISRHDFSVPFLLLRILMMFFFMDFDAQQHIAWPYICTASMKVKAECPGYIYYAAYIQHVMHGM